MRKFLPEPVPVEALDRIVEAGLWAPSALNRQPWFFHVLTGRKMDEFAILCRPIWDKLKPKIEEIYGEEGVKLRAPFYLNLGNAPAAIVIYSDKDDGGEWGTVSCGMAAQNILLAATAEGLASLYMAAQQLIRESVDEFFGETRRLIGCVLIGYGDEPGIKWPRREGRVDWGDIHVGEPPHGTH
ncbi:MAG: nitroreductase [bacterium]